MIILYRGGQGEYAEKKSRFIANIFPAGCEGDALERIAEIRKQHYNARHNCFAYVLGENNETERCSDDGEPSGTAGRPILDVLAGHGIHDAVAVVTRYFGGIKLGPGGLARAYAAAAKEALGNCVLLERKTGFRLAVRTDYNDIGKLQYMARNRGLAELDTVYADQVELVFLVPKEEILQVEKEILDKTAGRADMDRGGELWYGMADGEAVLL